MTSYQNIRKFVEKNYYSVSMSLVLSAFRSQSVKGSPSSNSKWLLRLAVPFHMVSKVICTTPSAQTVQYLPYLLVELLLYAIGGSCKLRLFKFGKV